MKAFQKFIFISLLLFVLIGAWQLSIGADFFKQFTCDVYGFLVVTKFLFPALAYEYVYERLLKKNKIYSKSPNILPFVISGEFAFIFVFSLISSFLLLYVVIGKFEFLKSFETASHLVFFMFIIIFSYQVHKRYNIIPLFHLIEKPIFYLKLFLFSIIGFFTLLLVFFATAALLEEKQIEVTSAQFIRDGVIYVIASVSIAFTSSLALNNISFFRKSILIPIVFTTAITFWIIKLLGYPQVYFRNFISEDKLLQITFYLCIIIVIVPIGILKRNFKIKKLTSNLSKKEAEYLQLKNQINPHFLFNNLNVLVSFIELDPKKAVDFGHHLSNVYRHYLKNQTEDYVSLQGEINFITEYLSIYKAKFEHGFSFKMPEEIAENLYILPNCLQELIDNIFKHNIIAEEFPLEIEIFIEVNTLVVQNTINKKEVEIASNFGLQNIKKRYLLLTNTDIQIIKTETHFSVKIPILELQS